MDVVPVVTPKDLSRFIRLPHQIYRDDPSWVAPLDSDEKTRLTPGKNPFFEHAEAAYFLARENGRDVGRIAASVDRNHDAFHGEKQAGFGFFEAESEDATHALLDTAARWGKEHGARVMRGPLNFTTNDDCGLLVQGFEAPVTLLMPYNPPRYAGWVEAAGLRKAKDLYSFKVPYPFGVPEPFERVTRRATERHRVRVRRIDMKRFQDELARVKDIYNTAWERNWGFVPMTDHEIDHMAAQLKPALDPRFALFAEIDGEAVGVLLAMPDVNVALKPLRGRLFPFGILRLLWTLPRLRRGRLMALGTKAGFRRRGVETALVSAMGQASKAAGYEWFEVGWTLEDNDLVNRLIQDVGGQHWKTHRIYERAL